MTNGEYANSKGITVAQFQEAKMAYLQCEGYDDAGNEYDTLDAWIDRRPVALSYEPDMGGRGVGQLGQET